MEPQERAAFSTPSPGHHAHQQKEPPPTQNRNHPTQATHRKQAPYAPHQKGSPKHRHWQPQAHGPPPPPKNATQPEPHHRRWKTHHRRILPHQPKLKIAGNAWASAAHHQSQMSTQRPGQHKPGEPTLSAGRQHPQPHGEPGRPPEKKQQQQEAQQTTQPPEEGVTATGGESDNTRDTATAKKVVHIHRILLHREPQEVHLMEEVDDCDGRCRTPSSLMAQEATTITWTGLLRETDGRRQEKQAPPLQQHPRPPRNQPAADAPLQPPNDEDPKQESPGPQSSQEGQTYQGQTERPPKPQQEPRQYQDRVRIHRGNPHTQTSRESHPPEKPKGPQHEERHCRLPRGPQHHTGNRSLSGPDKRSVEGALDTKSWTEKGS
ncbi:basic salivary proline-rich protein 3-like [Procambarus clarkii]|uniref:basic salivary proline-rich protein 3-like n=1 Tax=Procambarus clarkii TaxID=6728 RepID=UPI0037434CDB